MAHDKGLLKAFNSRDDKSFYVCLMVLCRRPESELSFEVLGKRETLVSQCKMDTESGSYISCCIGIASVFCYSN